MGTFKLWAGGDAHVGTDLRRVGRRSLAEAILQAERGGEDGGPPFEWDIMLDIGDLSGSQLPPDNEEGEELVAQYSVSTAHPREHFYNIVGNHDASGADEPCQWWFRKWADPTGEHSASSGVHAERRPYPVEGTWERYSFQVGNILFLAMGDRNDVGPPVGRGDRGGFPAGAVTRETFEWWVRMVEANPDKIIISAHHHMLRETTVASGPWEGVDGGYHGRFEEGAPKGASYLYWIGDKPDAWAFESYLEANPGAIDLWIGGHTHTHPDDTCGGRSHVERKWGVTFINVAALSKYHGDKNIPMSRLLTFTEGSPEVNVGCYLHTTHYAPQGWYAPAERTAQLRHAFSR
ncbi:MAG: metallophosphoesterase [Candidatus Latescibacteria bacterium]|nr:metallophosphoesterase [Candidatus Latescibacterota bacterium]